MPFTKRTIATGPHVGGGYLDVVRPSTMVNGSELATPFSKRIPFDSAGVASLEVEANDDAGTSPSGLYYNIGITTQNSRRSFPLLVPAAGAGVIDLDSVIPSAVGTPAIVGQQGPKGDPGAPGTPGAKGDPGPQGPQGLSGTAFAVVDVANSQLSVTNPGASPGIEPTPPAARVMLDGRNYTNYRAFFGLTDINTSHGILIQRFSAGSWLTLFDSGTGLTSGILHNGPWTVWPDAAKTDPIFLRAMIYGNGTGTPFLRRCALLFGSP